MKTLKKFTVFFLIAVMLLSLAACRNSNTVSRSSARKAKTPVGSWSADVDLTDPLIEFVQDEMGEMGLDMDSLPSDVNLDFRVVLTMDLKDDGSYHLELSKEALEQAVTQFGSSYEKFVSAMMEQLFQNEAEAAGLTVDEMLAQFGYKTVDEFFESILGSSIHDFVSSMVVEILNMNDFVTFEDGTYTIDGSSVALTSNDGAKKVMEYAKDSDTMAITVDVDTIGAIALSFTRK